MQVIGGGRSACQNDIGVLCVAERHKNVGLYVGTNVGLNATEKRVIAYLIESPEATADDMASAFGVSKRTIERTLKKLQEKGLLVRSGAKKPEVGSSSNNRVKA